MTYSPQRSKYDSYAISRLCITYRGLHMLAAQPVQECNREFKQKLNDQIYQCGHSISFTFLSHITINKYFRLFRILFKIQTDLSTLIQIELFINQFLNHQSWNSPKRKFKPISKDSEKKLETPELEAKAVNVEKLKLQAKSQLATIKLSRTSSKKQEHTHSESMRSTSSEMTTLFCTSKTLKHTPLSLTTPSLLVVSLKPKQSKISSQTSFNNLVPNNTNSFKNSSPTCRRVLKMFPTWSRLHLLLKTWTLLNDCERILQLQQLIFVFIDFFLILLHFISIPNNNHFFSQSLSIIFSLTIPHSILALFDTLDATFFAPYFSQPDSIFYLILTYPFEPSSLVLLPNHTALSLALSSSSVGLISTNGISYLAISRPSSIVGCSASAFPSNIALQQAVALHVQINLIQARPSPQCLKYLAKLQFPPLYNLYTSSLVHQSRLTLFILVTHETSLNAAAQLRHRKMACVTSTHWRLGFPQ